MLDLCDPKHAPSRCWEHEDCVEHPELGLSCGPTSATTQWSEWGGQGRFQDASLDENELEQELSTDFLCLGLSTHQAHARAVMAETHAAYPAFLLLRGNCLQPGDSVVLECAIPSGVPFAPRRIVLPRPVAAAAMVEDIQCDGVSQLVEVGEVPARTFGPDSVMPNIIFDACVNLFTIHLRHVGGDAITTDGALILGRFV